MAGTDNELNQSDRSIPGLQQLRARISAIQSPVAQLNGIRPLSPSERRSRATRKMATFIAHEMKVWMRLVDDFGYTRTHTDKMPRAIAWRPYRFAVQDVIFALTAIRHAKEANAIEIDVFLALDPKYAGEVPEGHDLYPYEPLSAARALTLMVLSEAFRCGVPLLLRFTNNVERTDEERRQQQSMRQNKGRVPASIMQLAALHGISGIDADSGEVRPAQARQLYLALAGFPDNLRDGIVQLAQQGLLTLERACYLVQHGVWTVPELEGIIRGCPYPDLVLNGKVQPEQRHLYHHAQFHARTALLGGVLDRAICARDAFLDPALTNNESRPVKGRAEGATCEADSVAGQPTKPGRDVEDDDRDVIIGFDADLIARKYKVAVTEPEALSIPPWRPMALRDGDPAWINGVPREWTLVALLRPRDEAGLVQYLDSDLERAAACSECTRGPVAVVVPQDFNDLQVELQRKFFDRAAQLSKQSGNHGVWLLICPESVRTLDDYAQEKLSRSRVLPE